MTVKQEPRVRDFLPEVSVVILNWNGLSFLQKFLPGVLDSGYPRLRVIVADNASGDGSVNWLRENLPSVEIIEHPTNMGYAGGYNFALKQIESDYYILLNSDVEVTRGWIEPMVALLESDHSIAACQPKILDFNNRKKFEYAGACGGWIDKYGYPFARGRVFGFCEEDSGQYDTVQSCFWASGAALFIRSRDFHAAGGFDESFFAHQEEIDLCWRLKHLGKEIFCVPQSVVYHVGGGTLPVSNPQKTFLNFRNNLMMLNKNLSGTGRFGIIFTRLLLDGVAGVQFLMKGKWRLTVAVLQAHFHFYRWAFKKRNAGAGKSIKTMSGYLGSSIVWGYFIKQKRTFFQIVGEGREM